MRTTLLSLFLFAALLFAVPGGSYSGTWASDSGSNSGKVTLNLNGESDSELTFTYQDQIIKPQKVSAKVADAQVEVVCNLDLEGLKLKTSFHGTADGKVVSGKYQTTADDGSVVDTGTWKVMQQ